MNNALRVLVGLPALLFIFIGLRWLIDPAGVAAEFGMPLMEGLGLSTQIGDLGSFFFAGGSMVLLGLWKKQAIWFQAPALLLACTAVFRTLAWGLQGASFAGPQIAVEVVLAVLLLIASRRLID